MASGGKLKGKVAIVTGGSRGIGREISVALGAQGASVVMTYQSNLASANETVSLIEASGSKAIAVKGDVTVAADVKAVFDKAIETFGAVNIVVHLAGILLSNYPKLQDTTEEEWDGIFTTNVKGTFLVCREAAKRLGPGGRIITTGSTVVATLPPAFGAYAATKAAVETFTKILAKELRGRKITANCIAPGAVATDMFFKGKTEQMIDSAKKAPPLERLGEVTDIAPVVLFLVSEEAEWVNGQVIRINGGVAC